MTSTVPLQYMTGKNGSPDDGPVVPARNTHPGVSAVAKINSGLWAAKEKSMKDNVYTRNGYKNREDYLRSLADDNGVPPMVIFEMAGILGAGEDFDALVSTIEDFSMSGLLNMEV